MVKSGLGAIMLARRGNPRYGDLQAILREMRAVAIGYSGGVDSTLLLKVAADVLGASALAMIGRSDTYPTRNSKKPWRWQRRWAHGSSS